MYSPPCLGTFERNLGGLFLYRVWKSRDNITYILRDAQSGEVICILPRTFNAWQDARDLRIWLLAKGLIQK